MSDSEFEDFGQSIADAVESFLVSLQGVSRDETAGTAIPLLLLCTSQVMSAGARLGVQQAFEPNDVFQPDVGPDPDLDEMRVRLAALLGDLDTYAHNFEPYDPDTLPAQISDDLTSMAADLANGRLERILPSLTAPRVPLFGLYPDRSYLPAKVRVFVDYLAAWFKKFPCPTAPLKRQAPVKVAERAAS